MKLKALFLALAVAGAGSSFALADDGHGGGGGHDGDHHRSSTTTTTATTTTATTTTTPTGCLRVELRGTLASVSATSFTLTVKQADEADQALVGQTATIAVDASTRVEWEGQGTLTGPNVGDQARVKAFSCPGSTAGTTTLTAKSVRANGAEQEQHDALKSHK